MASVLEATLEIVKAQASQRKMTARETEEMIRTIGAALREIQDGAAPASAGAAGGGVVCMVCGRRFKRITGKHLKTHGITFQQYQARYGGQQPRGGRRPSKARRARAGAARPGTRTGKRGRRRKAA